MALNLCGSGILWMQKLRFPHFHYANDTLHPPSIVPPLAADLCIQWVLNKVLCTRSNLIVFLLFIVLVLLICF